MSLDSIKSTAIVLYTSQQYRSVHPNIHIEKLHDLFMKRSFKTQVADCRLSAISVRAFPVSAYYPGGGASKVIWVSLLEFF
ncbi:MAG: hypothetical protein V4494_06350 [Chlamydiota bacterium]